MGICETEVLIIGGGVLGAATARELSKYKVDVTLVEKEVDVCCGSSKANVGMVNQGEDCLEYRPEYHRSKLVWDSMRMMEPLCQELEVPFKISGGIGIFSNDAQRSKFVKMDSKAAKVRKMGYDWVGPQEWIDQDTLRKMEPNITRDTIGGLLEPHAAVVDPMKLTIALAENATENGVHMILGTEVEDISHGVEGFEVRTNNGSIKTRFIVNAAGIYIDKIAAMVNADDFVLYPVKGYLAICDKKLGGLINHAIYRIPLMPGELNVVLPTVDGNLMFGITLLEARKGDLSSTKKMQDKALANVQGLLPDIKGSDVIKYFTGFMMMQNFELGWHECVVDASKRVPRFINVSIGYPGISAAPAAAKEVVELLVKEGLKLKENSKFNPKRKAIPDFSEFSDKEKDQLIAQDPRYAHVVCRCETVTEGEIVEAIKRGATTVDGVKHRVRAGMGRCQSGFCRPRVIKILARELEIPEEEITMKGPGSRELLYKNKELLKGGE
ncbi:MAG: FAD-dependent oxidoreductase [Thermodesulfobacteriota bacterium]|nr:FAD-dependent oxidoreductase [Thermodesulfobacteriota bacterium]